MSSKPPSQILREAREFAATLDAKLNAVAGYAANALTKWLDALTTKGAVEVGWREGCFTDPTLKVKREWNRVVSRLRKGGLTITETNVPQKNRAGHGGFWCVSAYAMQAPAFDAAIALAEKEEVVQP